MAVVEGMGTSPAPTAEELLARWRACFRSADFAALAGLYQPEAYLSGSRVTPSFGPAEIREYFDSLGPIEGADVEFTEVHSRLIGPGVLLVLTRAAFTVPSVAQTMRLTQVWVEDPAGWVIAGHHAAPIADLRADWSTPG
jgi:uncharacterized protein (TIGR02246 family)